MRAIKSLISRWTGVGISWNVTLGLGKAARAPHRHYTPVLKAVLEQQLIRVFGFNLLGLGNERRGPAGFCCASTAKRAKQQPKWWEVDLNELGFLMWTSFYLHVNAGQEAEEVPVPHGAVKCQGALRKRCLVFVLALLSRHPLAVPIRGRTLRDGPWTSAKVAFCACSELSSVC